MAPSPYSLFSIYLLISSVWGSGVGFDLICGLYYKPMTIVNDDSMVISKLETLLTDDARVIIYGHHMFIV